MLSHLQDFAIIVLSWAMFVLAGVNIVNDIIRYSRHEPGSYGFFAVLKWLMVAMLLAGWEYLQLHFA